jgi:D-alanyl-D-alanine carboxypeptidase (penicillin-binding protein 5/6)
MPKLLVRIFLALTLVAGCAVALPATSYADVRGDDLVAARQLGDGHAWVPDAPDIKADYAALCTKEGLVLWERNDHARVPMASTTKIMTALVALEHADPATPMLVAYGAAMTEGSTADLRVGDTATLKDLLVCMMVPSGNDAAVAIAENIAGTEYEFVKLMNERAASLGMKDTLFSNASGLTDEDNYTSASDYLMLTRAAMSNALFREIVGVSQATAEVGGRTETYYSTNHLLEMMDGANGVKTGFTDEAGYCLVASAKRDNFELYAVVLHSTSEEQRFYDSQTLLEWGFAHYRGIDLIDSTKTVANLAAVSWIDKTVPVRPASPVSTVIFDYGGEIKQEVSLTEKEGAIRKGEVVGALVWTQDGDVIAKVNLVAAENAHEPSFWEGVKIWWQRFIGGFFGDPEHAESTTDLPETFDLKIANVND